MCLKTKYTNKPFQTRLFYEIRLEMSLQCRLSCVCNLSWHVFTEIPDTALRFVIVVLQLTSNILKYMEICLFGFFPDAQWMKKKKSHATDLSSTENSASKGTSTDNV